MAKRHVQSDFEREQRGKDEPHLPRYESAWERRGDCSAPECRQKALVRIPTPTGWLQVCEYHYGEYWAEHYREAQPRRTANAVCDEIRNAASQHKRAGGGS